MQLNGIWKCKNGQFVRIERKEHAHWIGEVIHNDAYVDKDNKPIKHLEIIYLDNGNAFDVVYKGFDLKERKRGDEKG